MNKPSNHIPKLRFSEFSSCGPWKAQKLKSFLEPVSREVVKPTSKYLGLGLRSHGKGTFLKEDVDPAANSMERLYEVAAGDLIVNITFAWEGAIAIAGAEDEKSLVSHRFPTYQVNSKKVLPGFLRHVIRRPAFVYSLGLISPGGAGRNRVMSKKDFLELSVLIPDVSEQQRISDTLEALDDLIEAETEKLDALKDHKQGLLLEFFPVKGETLPKRRFPEFQDPDGWVEKSLVEIADYENGKAYEKDIEEDGSFVVVNARFISTDGKVRKYSNERYCIASKGDVLMVLSDLPKGRALAKCFLVDEDEKYAVNQRVSRLTAHSIDSAFLYYALDRHPFLLAFNDGLNQTHLSKGSVLECPIAFPLDENEQAEIVAALNSVDEQVTSQAQTVERLKDHKQGLLQQLLPVLDEVDG
ncbi:MAG: restriction endonuclease subunit S [Pseudomonadota bacterium]